jgi:hypothetical protein
MVHRAAMVRALLDLVNQRLAPGAMLQEDIEAVSRRRLGPSNRWLATKLPAA